LSEAATPASRHVGEVREAGGDRVASPGRRIVARIPMQRAAHGDNVGRYNELRYHRRHQNDRRSSVLARWQFWVTTLVAILVGLLAGYTMMLFSQNRITQAELAQRSQYVQQSVQLEGLYRDIVKALADLSVRNQDKALADLLTAQGITVNANAATPTPGASSTDAKKGAK